ncbi:MAG: domain, G-beta repeat [Gemmataceae bacterium]|nr:domain, G-beta repeat [Gemmataceae bacterium]
MSYRVILIVAVPVLVGPGAVRAADPTLPPGAVLRLGDTRFRAGGPVADLLFSADGAELTSRVPVDAGVTRVTVWDVATGTPLSAATEPRRPGTRIRWRATSFPDGPRGIVVGPDGVPVVRDFAADKDLARLTGHFARVSAVTVSPDGRRIATASVDGLIRVWDAATFRPIVAPTGHTAAVRGVEVSPDGRLALTTGADRSARVWDLATGREIRLFAIPDESRPAFTADGAAIRIPLADRVIVRDLLTPLEVLSAVDRRADPFAGLAALFQLVGVCVAVSPDGRTVAVGDRTGGVDLYETRTGQVRRQLVGHAGACADLTFTPDGSKLLTAGADHCVLVWPVRPRDLPLSAELKRETGAAKLWDRMARGRAGESYQAMARLAADPGAAVKMARLRLKPGTTAGLIPDARAVELLEAVGTAEARALLRELADDEPDSARTREAWAALSRLGEPRYHRDGVRTISGSKP